MSKAWRLLAGRAQGTSHLADNTPCEDYFCLEVCNNMLCIFVADGAGSAQCGGEGAKIACETALALSKTHNIDDSFAPDCIIAIQEAIKLQIQENPEKKYIPRDFACTFSALLATDEKTLCFQIGDGAIVIEQAGDLQLAIAPIQGEYANMTYFVSDEDALEHLVTKTLSSRPKKVALMTDGLQRLALNLAENRPHQPFFTPFFDALQKTPNNQNDALQHALDSFLNSESVNVRTDDDKTLILGVYNQ